MEAVIAALDAVGAMESRRGDRGSRTDAGRDEFDVESIDGPEMAGVGLPVEVSKRQLRHQARG